MMMMNTQISMMFRTCIYGLSISSHSLFLPRFQSNVLTSTIDRLQIIECAFIVRSTESLCFNDDAGYLDFSHFNLFETRASEWGRIDARARGLPYLPSEYMPSFFAGFCLIEKMRHSHEDELIVSIFRLKWDGLNLFFVQKKSSKCCSSSANHL